MAGDSVVTMIEEELERLRHIRSILIPLLTLSRSPKLREAIAERKPKFVQHLEDLASEVVRVPPRTKNPARVRKTKPVVQPRALAGVVPTAPIVVRPPVPKSLGSARVSPSQIKPENFAALIRAAERELQPDTES